MTGVLGLDIGGANIKAAHSDGTTYCQPFALWQRPDELTSQLSQVLRRVGPFERLAVTTTAELCDCFETKRCGIDRILAAVQAAAKQCPISVWTTAGRFVDPDTARDRPLIAAAANWHALATHLAGQFAQGVSLLIDTGSTTTDCIPLDGGQVMARGHTDLDRLSTSELIYLGTDRTPVMALGPTIAWRGNIYPMMSEVFATTGDVFLLSGQLSEQPDRRDTADGRSRTIGCAAARLLRMVGADLEMLSVDDAKSMAHNLAETCRQRIANAITAVTGRPDRFLLSGSGRFLAGEAARSVWPDVPQTPFGDARVSQSACAVALVHLISAHQ